MPGVCHCHPQTVSGALKQHHTQYSDVLVIGKRRESRFRLNCLLVIINIWTRQNRATENNDFIHKCHWYSQVLDFCLVLSLKGPISVVSLGIISLCHYDRQGCKKSLMNYFYPSLILFIIYIFYVLINIHYLMLGKKRHYNLNRCYTKLLNRLMGH